MGHKRKIDLSLIIAGRGVQPKTGAGPMPLPKPEVTVGTKPEDGASATSKPQPIQPVPKVSVKE